MMGISACMHARAAVTVRKEKVVVVVGATGTGKSRLAIELGGRLGGEVINSDKIQVYKGLDVIANKVEGGECRGVPHHLLGFVDPDLDYTPEEYVRHASAAAAAIAARGRLPIVAGGSLSLVKALAADRRAAWDLCFLWVHVAMRVLRPVLSRRVDEMVDRGLVEEARRFYAPAGDYARGVRRAVGVPEMDRFFRSETEGADAATRAELLRAAIHQIKANTHKLAARQVHKISRLPEDLGVDLLRLDSTPVFEAAAAEEHWDNLVLDPSIRALTTFLSNTTTTC